MENLIHVPISLGELLDKITILQIKLVKITDQNKIINIKNELHLLQPIIQKYDIEEKIYQELYNINLKMWEWHDWQRKRILKIKPNIIDEKFYFKSFCEHQLNDDRARIKKKINLVYNSYIIEEKQFLTHSI
jgi:hypothetical protein